MTDRTKPVELDELLAGRALGDLSVQESDRLDSMLRNHPDWDSDELEQTAAAVATTASNHSDLPTHVRTAIRRDAPAYLSQPRIEQTPPASSDRSWREAFAWITAAAALIVLAVLNWPSPGPGGLAQQRLALLKADDVIQVEFAAGPHPFEQTVTGDVVWSNERQAGFMRFKNMPTNDSRERQYQLWIIDPKRDAEPIDGGVFDIDDSGEAIVAIDAKLKVIDPKAFAITVEQPGGVVVSDQSNLPLLAQVAP